MWPLVISAGLLGTILNTVLCEQERVFQVAGTDSYLEAYKATRGDSANDLLDNAVKNIDREYVEQAGYPYPNPQPQYGPPTGGFPDYNYGPPRPQYGPPNPAPVYGPPNSAPAYNPPNPPPVYGPPPVYNAPSNVQVFYGVPHAMISFWDKLKYKLDLFTIGKIFLKLVIFKKILSFIAILGLLLFIPLFKKKGDSDNFMSSEDDVMRNMDGSRNYDDKLNNLAAFVMGAVDNFSKAENSRKNCASVYCKTKKVLDKLDKKLSYKRLAVLYSKELQA